MRKLLIAFLVMCGTVGLAQHNENIIRMNDIDAEFMVPYYPRQLIRLDSTLYVLTHATITGQSMRVVIDSGWYSVIGDGSGVGGGQWTQRGTDIYYQTGDVGVGTSDPVTNLTIKGSVSEVPLWVDSAKIDRAGLRTLHAQIIYNDEFDCWSDWNLTDLTAPQIVGGYPGQIINIKSIGPGRLYLWEINTDTPPQDLTARHILRYGDNVTLQFINNTWTEVGFTDFVESESDAPIILDRPTIEPLPQPHETDDCQDVDSVVYGGVTYHTTIIGDRCWLRENLNYGSKISGSTNQTNNGTVEKYCYNNADSNCTKYGGLYQWDEAMAYSTATESRGICPPGWHIPTMKEWREMMNFLTPNNENGDMKSTDTTYWEPPNTGATNISNLNMKGTGRRMSGSFGEQRVLGYSWTSNIYQANKTFSVYLDTEYGGSGIQTIALTRGNDAIGVRCIKDIACIDPSVYTYAVTSITDTTALMGGNATYAGNSTIIKKGVCWAVTSPPKLSDDYDSCGYDIGPFSCTIDSLVPETEYYVRAYAITACGDTAYGNIVSFETLANACVAPTVTTGRVYNISYYTAYARGTVTSQGTDPVTVRGFCWGTSPNPTTANSFSINGSGLGTYTGSISGLSSGTRYHIRAYATNVCGTSYGADSTFVTKCNNTVPMTVTFAYYLPGGSTILQPWTCSGTQLVFRATPSTSGNTYQWKVNGIVTGTNANVLYYTPNNGDSISCTVTTTQVCVTGNPYTASVRAIVSLCQPCAGLETVTVVHDSINGVAPVNKTVTYNTVRGLPGDSVLCWITQNLGSDREPLSATDTTEASAGWYWQFNRKQGFKGVTPIVPNAYYAGAINQNSNWTASNDPCTLEMGAGWRIPTIIEWQTVDQYNGWNSFVMGFLSPLKLHTGGFISCIPSAYSTVVMRTGEAGVWDSSTQDIANFPYMGAWYMVMYATNIYTSSGWKSNGYTIRCVHD